MIVGTLEHFIFANILEENTKLFILGKDMRSHQFNHFIEKKCFLKNSSDCDVFYCRDIIRLWEPTVIFKIILIKETFATELIVKKICSSMRCR